MKKLGISAALLTPFSADGQIDFGRFALHARKLLDNGHAKGKQITPDTALDGVGALGVPLHAGAEKFYKEAGLLK